jgi:hypothetical protein
MKPEEDHVTGGATADYIRLQITNFTAGIPTVVEWLALLLRTREFPDVILVPQAEILIKSFRDFSEFLKVNAEVLL